MTLEDYRRFYAEEIEQVASLTSPALVEAFARVAREKFLGRPPWQLVSAELRAMAAAGLIQASYRATIGQGVTVKIVREPAGFSASAVNMLAILNGGSLRDPELEAPLRQALGKAMATGAAFQLKSLRRDAHEPDDTCLWHTPGACLSAKPIICEPEIHI